MPLPKRKKPVHGVYRDQTKLGNLSNIKVFGCVNDGVVWDGATDEFLDKIEVGACGWPETTFTGSRPSLIEPGRRVANLTINKSVEMGWVHSFGVREGTAVIVGTPSYGSGTVRFKSDIIIGESSNAGVWFRQGARYQCTTIDVHNNYGANADPQILDDGTSLQGSIVSIEAISGANANGQDIIRLTGENKTISSLNINGGGVAGDGLVMGGNNNKVISGDIRDCTGSNGALILAAATQWSVNASINSCTTGATLEAGAGTPVGSRIIGLFGNTTDFVDFDAMTAEERKGIVLESKTGPDKKSREYTGISANVAADATTLKTISIPIAGEFPPLPEEVTLSVSFVSGAAPDYSQLTIAGTTITSSNIDAYIKFDSVGSGVVNIIATVG